MPSDSAVALDAVDLAVGYNLQHDRLLLRRPEGTKSNDAGSLEVGQLARNSFTFPVATSIRTNRPPAPTPSNTRTGYPSSNGESRGGPAAGSADFWVAKL